MIFSFFLWQLNLIFVENIRAAFTKLFFRYSFLDMSQQTLVINTNVSIVRETLENVVKVNSRNAIK